MSTFARMKDKPVFIITGKQGEGKTTTFSESVELLTQAGYSVSGFACPGEWDKNKRVLFFIKDIHSNSRKVLCKSTPEDGFEPIGRFYFNPDAIRFGEKLISDAKPSHLIAIDEVGKFELEGKVWSGILNKILKNPFNPLLLTVREQFLKSVQEHFEVTNPFVFNCKEEPLFIVEKMKSILKINENDLN